MWSLHPYVLMFMNGCHNSQYSVQAWASGTHVSEGKWCGEKSGFWNRSSCYAISRCTATGDRGSWKYHWISPTFFSNAPMSHLTTARESAMDTLYKLQQVIPSCNSIEALNSIKKHLQSAVFVLEASDKANSTTQKEVPIGHKPAPNANTRSSCDFFPLRKRNLEENVWPRPPKRKRRKQEQCWKILM